MLRSGSGVLAGPSTTAPSATANLLPWQLQLIVPSTTSVTGHPWWVQVAENARNSPGLGWVTTTSCSRNTAPPPTGMSAVLASAPPRSAERRVRKEDSRAQYRTTEIVIQNPDYM